MAEVPENRIENRKKRTLPKAAEPYKFKPGQSGNPGGRPAGRPISDELMEALVGPNGQLKKIVAAIVKKACKGDTKAFDSIANRIEGKPVQPHDVQGEIKGTVILSSVPRPQRTA